jgi:hypothetical protein
VKRLTIALGVVVFALAFAVGTATAGATVDEFPVGFVLTSETCPNLPPGTTVEGTGSEKSITNTRTDRNGVTTVINTTHAFGTATDQAGNSYVFNYANSFNVSNTGPTDPVFTGRMVDSFSLAGRGPARLTNGFQAGITTDLATFFTFEELNSRGDPIDFATGEELCDPL